MSEKSPDYKDFIIDKDSRELIETAIKAHIIRINSYIENNKWYIKNGIVQSEVEKSIKNKKELETRKEKYEKLLIQLSLGE